MDSLEKLRKFEGYAGRSELIRASIRLLLNDGRAKDSLKSGQINALLVITHSRLEDEPITRLKHEYEDIVETHIHSQISHNTCAELLFVAGDGKRVSSMTRSFQKEDRLRSVRLVVI